MGSEYESKVLRPENRSAPAETEAAPQSVHQLSRPTCGGGSFGALVQAKLRVGPAGDRYELEADQVAAAVMHHLRRPRRRTRRAFGRHPGAHPDTVRDRQDPAVGRSCTTGVRWRRRTSREAGSSGTPPASGSGRRAARLTPPRTRRSVGRPERDGHSTTRCGAVWSPDSVPASRACGFTQMAPQTTSTAGSKRMPSRRAATSSSARVAMTRRAGGQELLAHELTHVVQQGAATPATSPSLSDGSEPGRVRSLGLDSRTITRDSSDDVVRRQYIQSTYRLTTGATRQIFVEPGNHQAAPLPVPNPIPSRAILHETMVRQSNGVELADRFRTNTAFFPTTTGLTVAVNMPYRAPKEVASKKQQLTSTAALMVAKAPTRINVVKVLWEDGRASLNDAIRGEVPFAELRRHASADPGIASSVRRSGYAGDRYLAQDGR